MSRLLHLLRTAYYLPKLLWAIRPFATNKNGCGSWLSYRRRDEQLAHAEERCGIVCNRISADEMPSLQSNNRLVARLLQQALTQWSIEFRDQPVAIRRSPDISFIIAHKGQERLANLLATLKNLAAQQDAAIECIVVEQSVAPEAGAALPDWVTYIHTPPLQPEMPWCKSWAFNVGARAAKSDLLVFHDNDICVPARYAGEMLDLQKRGFKAMRLQRFVFYLNVETSKAVFDLANLPCKPGLEMVLSNCHGGSIAIDRQTYFKIGGHDESFYGWGGEDTEFFERCQSTKLFANMYLPFVHLYHAKQSGMKDFCEHDNVELFAARSSIPVAQRVAELCARNFGSSVQPDSSLLEQRPPSSQMKIQKDESR